jgi:hypothetical protein
VVKIWMRGSISTIPHSPQQIVKAQHALLRVTDATRAGFVNLDLSPVERQHIRPMPIRTPSTTPNLYQPSRETSSTCHQSNHRLACLSSAFRTVCSDHLHNEQCPNQDEVRPACHSSYVSLCPKSDAVRRSESSQSIADLSELVNSSSSFLDLHYLQLRA